MLVVRERWIEQEIGIRQKKKWKDRLYGMPLNGISKGKLRKEKWVETAGNRKLRKKGKVCKEDRIRGKKRKGTGEIKTKIG